ncbi:MAG: acetolactate synthase [Evtepia sp.]
MLIKQISVFIENQKGRLAEVLSILAEHRIDISALSLADTSDFGILRLIVDKPDTASEILRSEGLIVKVNDVLAIAMDDRPGGLSGTLNAIADISIEYMYAFVGKQDGKAVVVMRVSDADAAVKALQKDDVTIVDAHDIYRL